MDRRDGCPGHGRFQVINRVEIPKGEFTYDIAVHKIVELDSIYNFAFVYADRGSGEYQVEMLRKVLGDKVKGIHLGASHDVRDPVSREFNRKPIKPFMVNQTVMMLERGMLMIPNPKIDEELSRQMTNYQVERVSLKTGEPTYSNVDEHALDGMMLGLLAFIIEMPELAQTVEKVFAAMSFGHTPLRRVDPIASGYSFDGISRASKADDWDEPGSPPLRKVPVGSKKKRSTGLGWGSRGNSSSSYSSRRSF